MFFRVGSVSAAEDCLKPCSGSAEKAEGSYVILASGDFQFHLFLLVSLYLLAVPHAHKR